MGLYITVGNEIHFVARRLWEQGLPAMEAMRSFRNRGVCFASKLCSHNLDHNSGASTLRRRRVFCVKCRPFVTPHGFRVMGTLTVNQNKLQKRLRRLAGE